MVQLKSVMWIEYDVHTDPFSTRVRLGSAPVVGGVGVEEKHIVELSLGGEGVHCQSGVADS